MSKITALAVELCARVTPVIELAEKDLGHFYIFYYVDI